MKKIIISIFTIFMIGGAFATTVNYNWLVDDVNYAQTTCEVGDDLILPTPTPTKYGYHFVGWVETSVYGSWSRSGTPTPQNPIEPVFKPFSNTVLRAVGSGDNIIADSYNPETRTITRRIGVKVLDGTEAWSYAAPFFSISLSDVDNNATSACLCTHYLSVAASESVDPYSQCVRAGRLSGTYNNKLLLKDDNFIRVGDLTQFLADQYNAGTPVTIYYPLNTPVEESLQ